MLALGLAPPATPRPHGWTCVMELMPTHLCGASPEGWQKLDYFGGEKTKITGFEWGKRGGFWKSSGAAAVRGGGRQVAAPRGPAPRVPHWPRRHVVAAPQCGPAPATVPPSLPASCGLIPWNKTQTSNTARSPRQGWGKLPGTGRRQGWEPAHPGVPSPVVDGRARKSIHKIPHLGEHRCSGTNQV